MMSVSGSRECPGGTATNETEVPARSPPGARPTCFTVVRVLVHRGDQREPVASVLVVSAAEPARSGEVPSDVAPSKNSTDPVAGGATVAVNITPAPNVED
jgi:hypothetical protein